MNEVKGMLGVLFVWCLFSYIFVPFMVGWGSGDEYLDRKKVKRKKKVDDLKTTIEISIMMLLSPLFSIWIFGIIFAGMLRGEECGE